MLKEIVDFSKQLEKADIYDQIKKREKKIDKPIMVIPVSDDLKDIKTKDIYFVFKDVRKNDKEPEKQIFILEEKGKEKEIKSITNKEILFDYKKIKDETKKWRNVLETLALNTKPAGKVGNKCIATQSGTMSYSLLIFERNYPHGLITGKEAYSAL